MPNIKTGQTFNCLNCGKEFYRSRSHILRGITKSCGNRDCKSAVMSGAGNPFWGEIHSPETIAKIKATKRSRPPSRKGGPPKGWKPTLEGRAKLSAALKERWRTNRDKMLSCLPRGPKKTREEMRYRRNFTRYQRAEWKSPSCAWCAATDKLELDHIIPVMCGGENERTNAQTLCRNCNLWKMIHVDRTLFLAGLGRKQG